MHLSPDERTLCLALARAALPAGRLFEAPDAQTLARLEAFLATLPPALRTAYRAALRTLEATALLTHRSKFPALPLGAQLQVLETLDAREATRLVVRGLLTPVKAAYFDDPRLHRSLGCRYQVDRPARVERPRWNDQVLDGSTFSTGEVLECDVVVVGTGAGGAPVAHELASRGHAVLVLEEGPLVGRQDFTGRPVEMMKALYRDAGTTVALGNTAIPIPVGRAVGGTTLINSGTCFRVPERVLASWREQGLAGFTPEALAPHFQRVEEVLGVGPSPQSALGRPAMLIARGCDALGLSHHPLARNAPGCDGQGLCCFGCPTDAKRSTNVSWMPMALERGANLLPGFRVEQVLTEGGRALGVSGHCQGRALTVRAKVVVVACGTLSTPVLLERSGLCATSGQLGRNLSIHPAAGALARFDEPVHSWNTVPQGYAIDALAGEGIYFEGASLPLELTAMSLPGFGPAFMSLMEHFNHTLNFGFMVKDVSRGRVRAGRDGKPRITYWLEDADLRKIQRGFAMLARVFFAAGAREVHQPVFGHQRLRTEADVERLERASLAARHVDLTAYHPLGTARMGVSALHSVIDATHEAHDVTNLFVCDGSAMPSSLGVNPQVTIMAMALRAAGFIDQRLERLSRRAA